MYKDKTYLFYLRVIAVSGFVIFLLNISSSSEFFSIDFNIAQRHILYLKCYQIHASDSVSFLMLLLSVCINKNTSNMKYLRSKVNVIELRTINKRKSEILNLYILTRRMY